MLLNFSSNKPIHLHIKENLPIILLTVLGLLLRLYMAQVDPFLHGWDERFHALVARNMMDHPFEPMLNKVMLETYDPNAWCCNHIWIHKQPLFLWQMALSMKVFGVSLFALRLPSVLMGTLMIPMLYRVTYILTKSNYTISLLSAFLLCISSYQLQLIAGIIGMDHNDIALEFYVFASIWVYAEYLIKPKWYWIVLIGIFAGAAVLNKWLLGLSVFLIWGVNILYNTIRTKKIKNILPFTFSLLVCVLVFLPWQLYILSNWPDLAAHEYEFNRRHITEALEGHSGSIWFYLWGFPSYFGSFPMWFIPLGIIYSITHTNAFDKRLLLGFSTLCIFVFCFFSFVVKTKVHAHFFFTAPFFIMFIAIALFKFFWENKAWYWKTSMVIITALSTLQLTSFSEYLQDKDQTRKEEIKNTQLYKSLDQKLPSDIKILLNVGSFRNVEIMFYRNDLIVDSWWLSKETLDKLAQDKTKIAAFANHGSNILPDWVLAYPYLYIINLD